MSMPPENNGIPTRKANRLQDVGGALLNRGEPYVWALGGALCLGLLIILGFLFTVTYNGLITFYPRPIHLMTLNNGQRIAGIPFRGEYYRPHQKDPRALSPAARKEVSEKNGRLHRTLYRTGNYDLNNTDFTWVNDTEVKNESRPPNLFWVERLEWGPFIGAVKSLNLDGRVLEDGPISAESLGLEVQRAHERRRRFMAIERQEIGRINYDIESERLRLRQVLLEKGENASEYVQAKTRHDRRAAELNRAYRAFCEKAREIKERDARHTITLADIDGREKTLPISEIVRLYQPNRLGVLGKLGIYFSRWAEYLTREPREANTEGGVMPAIFGTLVMTVILALAVAPFGVVAALYLREYARQGKIVSLVRISVNNLAGVPSIVYGVFGLGFLAYILGGSIDHFFFQERLPNPTFGTGGLLWASLTLALLTVPVVIVATEEALAAVPQSMREGSLAAGASKWQTIRYIVLPRALPGVMTGLILAMARGAGEVAPLMLVGVVKMAPELPIDGIFPYLHLERSFMHLGFHIYDVGFQSRNSEAGKPMVFVTTLVLIGLVALMNGLAIHIRNRLKQKYSGRYF